MILNKKIVDSKVGDLVRCYNFDPKFVFIGHHI